MTAPTPHHTTNYFSTFILVSADCPSDHGAPPRREGSVAALQHALLAEGPYLWTSDALMVEVERRRRGLDESERVRLHAELFGKAQACLRASPLVKTYGWGLHFNTSGQIAMVGLETPEYSGFLADQTVVKLPGMRSRRA